MDHNELRQKFINFFAARAHYALPSAPLTGVDNSTLFTSAGMQSLTPYLNGSKTPPNVRLTNAQKCLRANDLAEVGDKTHLTFFEMLGSWSVGDYSKKEAIEFAHDFLLTEEGLNIPKERIWVTVFEGDKVANVPRDEEAARIWQDIGMPKDRIAYLPAEDNWWSAGETGLCGPDTEIFFDSKFDELGLVPEGQHPGNDPDGRFVEIWNSVFMSYDRKEDNTLENLPAQNVDQGAGLERLLAVVNGCDVYQTSCFAEVYFLLEGSKTKEIAEQEEVKSLRIISDHMRSILFILSEEPQIYPAAKQEGYILRHLIRSAVMHAEELGIPAEKLAETFVINAQLYGEHYKEVAENLEKKIEIFKQEQSKFQKLLDKAPGLVNKFASAADFGSEIPGNIAHDLHQTHGVPVEVIATIAERDGRRVDMEGYREAVENHQQISRREAAPSVAAQ